MTDQFEKLDKIGHGQNTIVWTGWDHELERSVAIKELDESAREDDRKVQAFLTEARFVASLDFESLLNVYDIDEPQRIVVTELLEGSLDELAGGEPMPPHRVRSVLQQALRALNYIHGQGVLYGQLRPGKMLYSRRGRLKLGSFQRVEAHGPVRSEVDKYTAPEAIDAKFGEVGPTLDLYCLGFTALELLLGPKFDDLFPVMSGDEQMSGVGWLRWHTSVETLPSTATLAPRAPADVAALLDALLQKHAADRPQSASAAYAKLNDVPLVPFVDGGEDSLVGGQVPRESRRPAAAAKAEPGENAAVPLIGAPSPEPPSASTAKSPSPSSSKKRSQKSKSPPAPRSASKPAGPQNPLLTVAMGAGGMALIALIAFGIWSLFFSGTGDVKLLFRYQPAAEDVVVTIDGDVVQPNEEGAYSVSPGEHKFEFQAESGVAEFVENVTSEIQGFTVELKKSAVENPVAPQAFELSLDVRPVEAKLSAGDNVKVERVAGTELVKLTFPSKALGEQVEIVAEHPGFASHRELVKLAKPSESNEVRSIILNPLLAVEPADARVEVNGAILKPNGDGGFVLPGDKAPWDVKISQPGYREFAVQGLSLAQLQQRQGRIVLEADLQHWLELGLAAIEEKRYREAVEHFDKVLAIDGKHAPAAFHRGEARLSLAEEPDDCKAAVQDFTLFLEETPEADEAGDALALRGRARAKLGDRDAAIDDYQAALARKSKIDVRADLADALYERGKLRLSKDNYGDAVADLDAAVKLDGARADFHAELGWAHHAVGKNELGVEDFTRAVEIAPKPEYLLGRAKLYVEMEQGESALQDLNRASQLDPENPLVYAERGNVFQYVLKNYDAAVDNYAIALEKGYSPKQQLHFSAGDAFLTNGDNVFSAGSFDQASLLYGLALEEYQAAQKLPLDETQAKHAANRILLSHRRHGDALRRRALYDRAADAYTQAINLSGKVDHIAMVSRAFCRTKLKDFDKAEEDLRAALELKKNYPRAEEYLALVFLRRGQSLAEQANSNDVSRSEQQALADQAEQSLDGAIDQLRALIAQDGRNKYYYQMIIQAHQGLESVDKDSAQTRADREAYEQKLEDLGGDGPAGSKVEDGLKEEERTLPDRTA